MRYLSLLFVNLSVTFALVPCLLQPNDFQNLARSVPQQRIMVMFGERTLEALYGYGIQ